MGELLSRTPQLQEHYFRWTNETECAHVEVANDEQSNEVTLRLYHVRKGILNRHVADRIFSGTPYSFVREDLDSISYIGPRRTDSGPGVTDTVDAKFAGIGQLWATSAMTDGIQLSKITSLFSLAYILGMLARYFPTQWTALVRGQMEDAALPIFSAAIEFIETNYPTVVADFLEDYV